MITVHITKEQEQLLESNKPIEAIMSPAPICDGQITLVGPYNKWQGYVEKVFPSPYGLLCTITL